MDTVDLVLTPTDDLTWVMLRFALLGLGSFMQRWEYVELYFNIGVDGEGQVATGQLFQDERGGPID